MRNQFESDISYMTKVTLTKEISSHQLHWRNTPSVYAWTRQNGILSKAAHEQWLEKIRHDSSIMMFGILNGEGSEVGTCGLTSISPTHGTAEFSLFIAPTAQKRGYGRAALIELLQYGFKHLRLNCIYGETFKGNPALNLFTSLGMDVEGTLKQRYFKEGMYIDTIMVSILHVEAREQSWWTS